MNIDEELFDLTLNELIKKGEYKGQSLRRTRSTMEEWALQEQRANQYVYFCTFTFKEKYLVDNDKALLMPASFKRYLVRKNCRFCLYPDWGTTGSCRFHYHGFISRPIPLVPADCDLYGFVKIEPLDLKSTISACKYACKYACKMSDRKLRLIKSHSRREA
jgi:hypothetical protein